MYVYVHVCETNTPYWMAVVVVILNVNSLSKQFYNWKRTYASDHIISLQRLDKKKTLQNNDEQIEIEKDILFEKNHNKQYLPYARSDWSDFF